MAFPPRRPNRFWRSTVGWVGAPHSRTLRPPPIRREEGLAAALAMLWLTEHFGFDVAIPRQALTHASCRVRSIHRFHALAMGEGLQPCCLTAVTVETWSCCCCVRLVLSQAKLGWFSSEVNSTACGERSEISCGRRLV